MFTDLWRRRRYRVGVMSPRTGKELPSRDRESSSSMLGNKASTAFHHGYRQHLAELDRRADLDELINRSWLGQHHLRITGCYLKCVARIIVR
jgi:hypothetical protein